MSGRWSITVREIKPHEAEALVEQLAGMTREEAERCECEPCLNRATVSVGSKGDWHLCVSCAAKPEFSRYRTRKVLPR